MDQGSNSFRDWMTDFDWNPIAPLQQGVFWGSMVHRGFYLGLFGQFKVDDDFQVPYGSSKISFSVK
jgi:hypothetical protein